MKKVQKLFVVMFMLMLGISFLTNCSAPTPSTPAAAAPTATPVPPEAPVGTIQTSNINGPMIFGDTSYASDAFLSNICGYGTGPDDLWVLDVPSAPQTLHFSTCNVSTASSFQTVLTILKATGGAGVTEIACNGFNSCGNQSAMSATITSAGRYYLYVDGAFGTYGTYGVTITSP